MSDRGQGVVTAEEIKAVMFSNIHCINFMHERRNEAFQMQGRYDGSMSAECKESFREQFGFWDALIKESEGTAPCISGGEDGG